MPIHSTCCYRFLGAGAWTFETKEIRVLQDPLLSGSKAAQGERRALLRRLPTPAAGWVGSSPSGVSSLVLIFAGSQVSQGHIWQPPAREPDERPEALGAAPAPD